MLYFASPIIGHPNFLETINILNNNKIQYWLCHGTLLGIIRDNELIPWDHDIDIAVWDSNNLKDKFLPPQLIRLL